MIGARLTAPGRLEIVDLPPVEPAPGDALVRLHTAGICGTDLHSFHGRNPLLSLPRVLGHELAGTVAGGDTDLPPGTPVVIDPRLTCGACRPCRIGRSNCCEAMRVLGVHVDGGFRGEIAVPTERLHVLPAGVSLELGALVEPLSIGANAVLRGGVTAGDTVLVQGAGAIGLAALLLARAAGAWVVSSDPIPARRELALRLGAGAAVDPHAEDEGARVLELTGGEGAAVVIEATGRVDVLRRALDHVAAAGVVVTLLISPEALSLPVTEYLVKKELDLRGSRLNRDLFPRVIELLANGVIDPSPMITQRYPLADAPAAMAFASEHPGEACKVLLRVS
ncbi:MAG: alcohol dehydrogenase catalytic domain-containing protein [Armatimonadetes bacterium]|nr:alcohol dehydrogenase catalytic domain-containing protein [Armatimonadota bacterium]